MRKMKMSRVFTLIEPGPVVLVTTFDGNRNNMVTISWTMELGFKPIFAITSGPWNHSFAALLDRVVGIGTCSGSDTDKFAKFRLTAVSGKVMKAPLINECLANFECKVFDQVAKYNIVVLEGVVAYENPLRKEGRMIHAVGDGTFVVDGGRVDRRKMMASKLPKII